MRFPVSALVDYGRGWIDAWNRFWFRPTDPATLGVVRILAGAMLFYTHLVWAFDLDGFFGPEGRLPDFFTRSFHDHSPFAFSYLYWIDDSPWMLGIAHGLALMVLLAFTLGLGTRVTGVMAFIITISYANRATGALFGLDQINGFLALYLAIGPSGAAYSLDRWLARRRQPLAARSDGTVPSSGANLSIRLIQVHMCVVYLFAGLGKLQGESWWNGEAFWGAAANLEYQTLDLTWLAAYPWLINIATHVTVFWEVSYAALVWPSRTRPLVLLMAIPLHLGIAVAMGMITFGLVMLIANLAFVSPELVRRILRWPVETVATGKRMGATS